MTMCRIVISTLFALVVLHASVPARAGGVEVRPPPEGYNHTRFAPEPDIAKVFRGFALSFDSDDEDLGMPGLTRLRVPHWVAQEVREWKPTSAGTPSCLNTSKGLDRWFTDKELRDKGIAPVHDSYTNSGFERGHMAMRLLVERLDQDAALNTFTMLNAVPQRKEFNQGIWKDLELLTGAWAQRYGRIWVIQGPVFTPKAKVLLTEGKSPRQVAVPDAVFKIVIRDPTAQERSAAPGGQKNDPQVLAFLYPQLGPGYTRPGNRYRHESFLTTVDEIEELTFLDFKLSSDTAVEQRVEALRAETLWQPSDKNDETRQYFVNACQGKQRAK